MFALWFLLGALIKSDTFLPYAVMTGSTVAVVWFMWANFTNNRAAVLKYLHDNLQLLLAVALDHWFDTSGVQFVESVHGTLGSPAEDEKNC